MQIDPHKIYCTYMHIYDDGRVFYGWGRISSAYEPKLSNGDAPFTVFVETTFSTVEAARNARHPQNASVLTNAIRCEETGVIFRSQAEAARATFTDPGRMSQHLKRTPGHKKIRGMTFTRVDNYTGEFSEDLVQIHSMQVEAYMNQPKQKKPPKPWSLAAASEDELKEFRALAVSRGFTPTV